MLVARQTETPNLNARSSTGQSRRIRMRVIRISSSRERIRDGPGLCHIIYIWLVLCMHALGSHTLTSHRNIIRNQ